MESLGTAIFLLVLLVLAVGYVMFWLRTFQNIQASGLDLSSKGMWTLAILVFQLFGPIVWWLAGPGSRHR